LKDPYLTKEDAPLLCRKIFQKKKKRVSSLSTIWGTVANLKSIHSRKKDIRVRIHGNTGGGEKNIKEGFLGKKESHDIL